MTDNLTRILQYVMPERLRRSLEMMMRPLADRLSSQTLVSPALRIIGGSGNPSAETNAATTVLAGGKLVAIASGADMATLSGSITAGSWNVFAFFVDSAGALSMAMGVEATTLAGVVMPQIPEKQAMLGFVRLNPTATFTGGTDNLDSVTVTPNAVFVNTIGAIDPTVLLG